MQNPLQRPEPELEGLSRSEVLKASPPMFSNRVLDRLTRVHWSVVPGLYVPVIAAFLVLSLTRVAALHALGYVILGYIVWTLTEYWLHRVVFHFEPDRGIGAQLHWMIHGVHHDHPNDPMRLVMPPSASVPLGLVFAAIFQLALPFGAACGVSAGFFAGYLAYDMTHYYVHHVTPRGPIGRRLRELHMRHHFQDDTAGFGVSAPWWDHVFGTAPSRGRERD
ncbi:MAG TPA: sterol desaturase family protein [Solirubrobacteraceae bacterium]|jgi:sterol desaturase/sphingolipid hydroxylase (fatty acid hydroxylase superfamily)|nr:sterol desaturase family protein [Solirubrobacteraceae bacterium]